MKKNNKFNGFKQLSKRVLACILIFGIVFSTMPALNQIGGGGLR